MLQHQVLRRGIYQIFVYFICLFVVFRPTREFFHSFEHVSIAGERLQIFTYTRYLWPLSSVGL